jgi:hypothetical protein
MGVQIFEGTPAEREYKSFMRAVFTMFQVFYFFSFIFTFFGSSNLLLFINVTVSSLADSVFFLFTTKLWRMFSLSNLRFFQVRFYVLLGTLRVFFILIRGFFWYKGFWLLFLPKNKFFVGFCFFHFCFSVVKDLPRFLTKKIIFTF